MKLARGLVTILICTAIFLVPTGLAFTGSKCDLDVTDLSEHSHHVSPERDVIETRIGKHIEKLPQHCSQEVMAKSVKEILPNAIVIGADQAQAIKTAEDMKKLILESNKGALKSLERDALEDTIENILDMVNYVANNAAKNDMYVIIAFDSQDVPVGMIVSFCVMCAKWVYMYYFKHEMPPFVEDTI